MMAQKHLWIAVVLFQLKFLVVRCGLPNEVATAEMPDEFPTEKCESLLTNCSCYDYEIMAGIICSTLADFAEFTELLGNGSIFEVNTTYEITVTGVRSLANRSMEGLIVFRLFLDDLQTEEIEAGAFEGVMRLRRFHIRQSSIQKIPDFRSIKDSFRNLNFDNSRLTALEGQGLQDLYLMERLSFVNNSIDRIDPDVFKGTDIVRVFDVSHNLLTTIPENLFDNWNDIRKVVLSHNRLIHVDGVFETSHPRFIYLDYNNLTDIDAILHHNMTSVETLLLANNPFTKVSENTFNFKVPSVRFIYLDHCLIEEFNVTHFQNLSILATLDLSANLITKVPYQTVAFGDRLELDFIGNQISEFKAVLSYSVKRIYLTKNNLRQLGTILQFTQLAEVSVSNNHLQSLTSEDFRSVHGMKNIELQANQIHWVGKYAFVSIRNDLHYLDLSDNRLKSLNNSVKFMSQVKALNVSKNFIEMLYEDEFIGMNELSELYLQHNRLTALNGQLSQLPQLQYLVIRHNAITTLSSDQIPSKLQYLYVQENRLRCDCKLLPFLDWMSKPDSPGTDVPLCAAASADIPDTVHPCPYPCSCSCVTDMGNSFITIDCSSRNMSSPPDVLSGNVNFPQERPSELEVQLQWRMDMIQNSDPRFSIHDQVLGLNLENNSFSSLEDWRIPNSLAHLYVANNNLRRLPESMVYAYSLPNLHKVTLSGNPWDCDCKTVGFKTWLLSKMDIVQDVNVTRCRSHGSDELQLNDKVIVSLSDVDLCPTDIGFYITMALSLLSFLLLVAALKIAYTRYEMNIKVWLYSHGISWVKEKDIDKDKPFDAFLSFSHKDEAFVANDIIAVIEEKEPNINLCIHYRHFLPGEFIHNNILNAVKCSKRTVLILSRNFLESEWCLMEFRAAHIQALEDKLHRIIVIKLGDLPKEIDPAIKVYLDSTTYLTWGEKYFWQNLLYVLPIRSTPRSTAQII